MIDSKLTGVRRIGRSSGAPWPQVHAMRLRRVVAGIVLLFLTGCSPGDSQSATVIAAERLNSSTVVLHLDTCEQGSDLETSRSPSTGILEVSTQAAPDSSDGLCVASVELSLDDSDSVVVDSVNGQAFDLANTGRPATQSLPLESVRAIAGANIEGVWRLIEFEGDPVELDDQIVLQVAQGIVSFCPARGPEGCLSANPVDYPTVPAHIALAKMLTDFSSVSVSTEPDGVSLTSGTGRITLRQE